MDRSTRLGNVVYWLACFLAVLSILAAVAVAVIPSSNPHDKPLVPIFLAVLGAAIWIAGRGIKYILGGR